MLTNSGRKVRGFSLIELMVAIVVGMFVVAGATSLIIDITGANASTIEATRLTQELRATMQLIADDVLRARRLDDPFGEIGKGALASAQTPQQYYYGAYDPISSPSKDCLLYTYQGRETNTTGFDHTEAQDQYQDTGPASATLVRAVTNDRAIYRTTDASGVGAVVLASAISDPTSGAVTAPGTPTVSAARTLNVACNTAGTTLSSSQVDITLLRFDLPAAPPAPPAGTPPLTPANSVITVTLSGKLRFQSGKNYKLTRTLTQTITVRSPMAGR